MTVKSFRDIPEGAVRINYARQILGKTIVALGRNCSRARIQKALLRVAPRIGETPEFAASWWLVS